MTSCDSVNAYAYNIQVYIEREVGEPPEKSKGNKCSRPYLLSKRSQHKSGVVVIEKNACLALFEKISLNGKPF